jgi:hypothetical protein
MRRTKRHSPALSLMMRGNDNLVTLGKAITLAFVFLCLTPLPMTQFAIATTSSSTPESTSNHVPTASLIWQFNAPNLAPSEYNVNSWTLPVIANGFVYIGMSGTHVYDKVFHYTPEGPWDSGT